MDCYRQACPRSIETWKATRGLLVLGPGLAWEWTGEEVVRTFPTIPKAFLRWAGESPCWRYRKVRVPVGQPSCCEVTTMLEVSQMTESSRGVSRTAVSRYSGDCAGYCEELHLPFFFFPGDQQSLAGKRVDRIGVIEYLAEPGRCDDYAPKELSPVQCKRH